MPRTYLALNWARDLGISYPEVLELPMSTINQYLEIRQIEDELQQDWQAKESKDMA